MEEPFDYTRCSLRELEDVAERINRERYPQRYAQVIVEIEKRRADPDLNSTRPSDQSTIAALTRFVAVEYGILASLGIVWPLAVYNSPWAPQADMPMGLLLVPITALFFAFVAVCFALMRRALEPICERSGAATSAPSRDMGAAIVRCVDASGESGESRAGVYFAVQCSSRSGNFDDIVSSGGAFCVAVLADETLVFGLKRATTKRESAKSGIIRSIKLVCLALGPNNVGYFICPPLLKKPPLKPKPSR